jgi:hypothetical protein
MVRSETPNVRATVSRLMPQTIRGDDFVLFDRRE